MESERVMSMSEEDRMVLQPMMTMMTDDFEASAPLVANLCPGNESRAKKRFWLFRCFRRNVQRMAERRLTTDYNGKPVGATIIPMHKDNIRKLKNAYRHPFERIHEEYFECSFNDEIAEQSMIAST
jgi:hypothetical protein